MDWSPAPRADVSYAKYPWPKYRTPSFPWCMWMSDTECVTGWMRLQRGIVTGCWLCNKSSSEISSYSQGLQKTIFKCTVHRLLKQMHFSSRRPRWVPLPKMTREIKSIICRDITKDWKNVVGWVCCNIWIVGIRIWCKTKLNKRSTLPCW